MTISDTITVTPVADDEFLEQVAQGVEPRDHLGNVRLAWALYRRFGYAAGLAATEAAIRARAERTGGSWDPVMTRCWYDRVTVLAAGPERDFDAFLAAHAGVLRRPAAAASAANRSRVRQ